MRERRLRNLELVPRPDPFEGKQYLLAIASARSQAPTARRPQGRQSFCSILENAPGYSWDWIPFNISNAACQSSFGNNIPRRVTLDTNAHRFQGSTRRR